MTSTPAAAASAKAIDTALTKPVSGLDNIIDHLSSDHTGLIALAIDWGARLTAAILLLLIAWLIGNWISRRFGRARHLDPTLSNFLGHFAKYTLLAVSVITVVGLFGIPMASLLAVMGAAGLAVGLALQGTLSNVASGVMILVLRPFNVGDYIDYNSGSGIARVLSLGLFGTELMTVEGVFIYAPNSKIWGGNDIKNYSRNSQRRQDVRITIAGTADLGRAVAAIEDVLKSDERVLKEGDRQPDVAVDTVTAASIALIVRFWSHSQPDLWQSHGAVTKAIRDKLAAEGIALA
jgi:small conductance mechanosensitive channel